MALPIELWTHEIAPRATDAGQLIMKLVCFPWMRRIRGGSFTWRPRTILPFLALDGDDARLVTWAITALIPTSGNGDSTDYVSRAADNAVHLNHVDVLRVLLHLRPTMCDMTSLVWIAVTNTRPRAIQRLLIHYCGAHYYKAARAAASWRSISAVAAIDTANYAHVCECMEIAVSTLGAYQCGRILGLPVKPETRVALIAIIERKVRVIRRRWVDLARLSHKKRVHTPTSDAQFDAWWMENDTRFRPPHDPAFIHNAEAFEYWWIHRNDPPEPAT